jgi:hypothetical protein
MCRNLDLRFILFYCLLSKFFFLFFPPIFTFLLSVLLSFLLLSNWFLFLSSFIFPLLFRHCFIPVSLAHVVSYLAYPNLLGTKRLGCCIHLYCFYHMKIPKLTTKPAKYSNSLLVTKIPIHEVQYTSLLPVFYLRIRSTTVCAAMLLFSPRLSTFS